jgi:hypothetical protein
MGKNIYYDPKDIKTSEIPRRYRASVEYGKKHCPDKVKTGWKALGGKRKGAPKLNIINLYLIFKMRP